MIQVYSKNNCPFCDRAKALLELKGLQYEEIRVDLDPTARQFLLNSGHRSVPQIYHNGELLVEGGYNGLAKLSDIEFNQLKEKSNVN